MANIAVRRAVYCLVVIPAILEGHAHCVAVKVFVVSDVFAHGDFLFVVWVDGLILTQVGGGCKHHSTIIRNCDGLVTATYSNRHIVERSEQDCISFQSITATSKVLPWALCAVML